MVSGSKTTNKSVHHSANDNSKQLDEVIIVDSTDTAISVNSKNDTDEPLDLADLDLSRLRLSKKDLETLSTITPGLPKCFQEQLLAKLPPTQARKLSRTLSMQNNSQATVVRSYKRSQSSGRALKQEGNVNGITSTADSDTSKRPNSPGRPESLTSRNTSFSIGLIDDNVERNSNAIYGRSSSRSRYDFPESLSHCTEASARSRASSVCRDDNVKSLCSPHSSDISDKYKYYSPYLSKSSKDTSVESGSISPVKRYGSVSPRESCHSPNVIGISPTALGRPPSGCLSPPPALSIDGSGSSSLRRRSSQRRISRFLRPDFFEEPSLIEENVYLREKKLRERETQSILREIREKSRESSRDRLSNGDVNDVHKRQHSVPRDESNSTNLSTSRHVRNKSMEMQLEGTNNSAQQRFRRRSLSRSRDLGEHIDKSELADKILQELQILSAVKSQHDSRLASSTEAPEKKPKSITDNSPSDQNEEKEKIATLKKIKKLKPKETSNESIAGESDAKPSVTVIKKVKKITKKTETVKTSLVDDPLKAPPSGDSEKQKPESKLKRPKSYPMKESIPTQLVPNSKSENPTMTTIVPPSKLPLKSTSPVENSPEVASCNQHDPVNVAVTSMDHRENRLVRPKSYPASKLAPPKIARSGIALPSQNVDSTCPNKLGTQHKQAINDTEKTTMLIPNGKNSIDSSSSSSESRPPIVTKKVSKINKKSKLIQPSVVKPVPPTLDELTETMSVPVAKTLKEKSPEKKVNKGLLYAISQKFEKLRDSAMNKEKKSTTTSTNPSTANASPKQSSPDKASPEKFKEKTKMSKKKKAIDGPPVENNKSRSSMPSIDDSTKAANSNLTALDSMKPIKSDKRSRIDAMIRSLRERSVPRLPPATETHYIVRAVSVEEMPGTFNRNAVNKVLGLFKRFEKDGGDRKVRNTRSTSNIERQIHKSPGPPLYENIREDPKMSKHRDPAAATTEKPKSVKVNTVLSSRNAIKEGKQTVCDCEPLTTRPTKFTCTDCIQNDAINAIANHQERSKSFDVKPIKQDHMQSNKDKRKALMLDLTKLEKLENNSSVYSRNKTYLNGNGIYSNLPPYPGALNNFAQQNVNNNNNNNNNNSNSNNNSNFVTNNNNNQPSDNYRPSSAHEINRNDMFSPSCENIANYSSDSRSYQDDCASTSTFMSPTDEPELYFDNWSVCSEDNYMLATPSPTVSRLSRFSQLSSPTRGGDCSDPNESVIDRIKRRSFYCRFNEKKPRRTSSIVGPSAVRDYYREQQAAVKARNNTNSNKTNTSKNEERATSPDITQQFLRPLKLSPVGTELKPPIYKAPHDYASANAKPRKSLNDIRPNTSPSFLTKRYGSASMNSTNDNEYLSLTTSLVPTRVKVGNASASGNENNGVYYNTYNPKRRSSYNLANGGLPNGSQVSGAHNIDGYATVGRRSYRPYDQRTMSMLEPPSARGTSFRRETRPPLRDYPTSISRSNSNYRTPAAARSPTNI